VEDFVLELHIERRHIPCETEASSPPAQLVLPCALSIELDEAGNRKTVQLEQERWLIRPARISEQLSVCAEGGCDTGTRCQPLERSLVRLVAVREKEILRPARRVFDSRADDSRKLWCDVEN